MDTKSAYDCIEADMRAIVGDMAPAMLRKRLRDVHADVANLTREDLEKIVVLLRDRTFPSILGADGAQAKAVQYLAWIGDGP